MNVQRNFGLCVQRQSLVTEATGGTLKKDRCPFSHYGFLIVDRYCQSGIPLDFVYRSRSRLRGPHAVSGLVVRERREHKQKKNPFTFICKPEGVHIAVKVRQLDTQFANAMVSQFLVVCEVRDGYCRFLTMILGVCVKNMTLRQIAVAV
jgi:hypothetical protein